MNARVSKMLSLIPDRAARTLSGVTVTEQAAAATRYADRFTHLARWGHWLSPLDPVTKDDLRLLGFAAAHARPVPIDGDLVGDDLLADAETEDLDAGWQGEAGTQIAPELPPSIIGGSHA